MYFHQEIIGNSRAGAEQWQEVAFARNMANQQELNLAPTVNQARRASNMPVLAANQGIIPQDVYQEFDNVTVERMRSDDGDTFLNVLMPRSRSISIGKLLHKFRQASDAGNVQTSMTGQIGVKMDQTAYKIDGSIVPIHDTGYSRNWREWNAQTSEGFDALIDDQRNSVESLRKRLANTFLDGNIDKSGEFIVVDGVSWQGIRNDSRVAQVSLVFDFTDITQTGAAIKAAFIAELRNVLWIDNNCEQDVDYYISREIASNFEQRFSAQYDAQTILAELSQLQGVGTIRVTNKMVGNEMFGIPSTGDKVRPIVGMGINTVAQPRLHYNSNYEFVVWGASGWEVRTDYFGNTCAIYGG